MLHFYRQASVRIVIEKSPSEKRGFLFFLAVGVAGEVDPLSGMVADLTRLDQDLAELIRILESKIFSHLFELNQFAHQFLKEKYLEKLIALRWQEQRNWGFAWDTDVPKDRLYFEYIHHLEFFPQSGSVELLKIHFQWSRPHSCEEDLHHQGFLVLKSLGSVRSYAELNLKLKESMGKCLISGAQLVNIEVDWGLIFSTMLSNSSS